MGVSWTGLGAGIERGLTLGLALDEHRENKEDREYERGLQTRKLDILEAQEQRAVDTHQLTDAANRLALQDARDSRFRKNGLDKIHAGQYAARQFGEQVKNNEFKTPEEFQAAYDRAKKTQLDAINFVGRRAISQGNRPGETKRVSNMMPYQDGRVMVEIESSFEDGRKEYNPMTKGRSSDPNDAVMMLNPSDPTSYMSMAEKILTDWDELATAWATAGHWIGCAKARRRPKSASTRKARRRSNTDAAWLRRSISSRAASSLSASRAGTAT